MVFINRRVLVFLVSWNTVLIYRSCIPGYRILEDRVIFKS